MSSPSRPPPHALVGTLPTETGPIPTGAGTPKLLFSLTNVARSPLSPPVPRGMHAPRQGTSISWIWNLSFLPRTSRVPPGGGDCGDRKVNHLKFHGNLIPTRGGDRVGTVGIERGPITAPA